VGLNERTLAFAAMGVLGTTQELASRLLADVPSADPQVLAEETFTMVATASARTAESVLGRTEAVSAILDLPLVYREYVAGGMLVRGEADESFLVRNASDELILRRRGFYEAHFEPEPMPSERTLREKMGLWMGRVSPSGLPELPMDRLDRLGLVAVVDVHLKLVAAFARRQKALDSGADNLE